MNNLFIYTTPHPAHKALAEALKCKDIKSSGKIPFFGRLINAYSVNNKIGANKYDVILTESISRDLLAGAYYKKFHPKTKLIALLTDPKLFELSQAPLIDKYLTYWALDKADLLLVGSRMMKDLVPYPYRYKTRLFYPGVKNIDEHLKIKAKHGKNIAFIGLLGEYKGTDLLAETFKKIKSKIPGSKLYVVGRGADAKLFENKEDKGIFYLEKTENSLFMGNVASFYMSRARYEPSGCAVIEAMAQGLVPIVSDRVGYKDIVAEVDESLIIESDSRIVEKVRFLSENKKEWEKLSAKCKQVAKKYSYVYMISNFKQTLRSFFKKTNI